MRRERCDLDPDPCNPDSAGTSAWPRELALRWVFAAAAVACMAWLCSPNIGGLHRHAPTAEKPLIYAVADRANVSLSVDLNPGVKVGGPFFEPSEEDALLAELRRAVKLWGFQSGGNVLRVTALQEGTVDGRHAPVSS